MNRLKRSLPNRETKSGIRVIATLCLLAAFAGCTGGGIPIRGNMNLNRNVNMNAAPRFGILNFQSNVAFSDNITLTVLYSTPADSGLADAFVQQVSSPNAGGEPIGVEQIIATDLPAGENLSFELDTTDLRAGFYRIGLRVGVVTYLSAGTLEIQGPPSPLFLVPASDVTVEAGDQVPVSADVGDPQGVARWRLFYQDADAPQNQEGSPEAGGQLLGQRIAEGSGNTVDVSWDTRNIAIGPYRLGLSATDSGLTVGGAVMADRAESIVTTYSAAVVQINPPPSQARPPTIDIITPDVTAFGGDPVEIEFTAQTFQGDDYLVTFFFIFNGEQTVFATVTDRGVTSVTFETEDLVGGIYAIGATISDGLNPAFEVPSAQRLRVNVVPVDDADLVVSQPGGSIRVAQGDEVTIEWTTNVPAGRGEIDVFARTFSATSPTGVVGTEVAIIDNAPTSTRSATWTTTGVRGLFVVLVRLTITDPMIATPIVVVAPGRVRVSLTASQFWIGQIGQEANSTRAGEIYQGVNFQDNAGTFLTEAGDFNRDGLGDFLVGARYGKPFFQNPSGVGIGEAYLMFGGDRANATHKLNTVGTSELRGAAITGIRSRALAQDATDGLSSMRIVPDRDGDRVPELMFGFPYTDSRGHTYALVVRQQPEAEVTLEKARQFLRGGVVIVSSTTPALATPPTEDESPAPGSDFGGRNAVFLDLVGQNFRKGEVLETDSRAVGTACGGKPTFFFDLFMLDNTNICRMGQDTPIRCFETFDGPWEGFGRDLADSYTAVRHPFSFPTVNTGIECNCLDPFVGFPGDPFLAACPISHNIGGFVDPVLSEDPADPVVGSGFYPLRFCTGEVAGTLVDNAPMPPFGARIIGRSPGTAGMESTTGDRFGASIATSGDFLLISAPNRQPTAGEVPGLGTSPVPTSPGLIYLVRSNNLWEDWRNVVDFAGGAIVGTTIGRYFYATAAANEDMLVGPPMPYQYQIDSVDQCGRRVDLLERSPSPFKVLGESGQKIETVEGISDFNLDGREDFVIGAPLGNAGAGVMYIAYRRDAEIEGDYILSKLSLNPENAERLAGMRINGRTGEGFGEVVARSLPVINEDGSLSSRLVDFNGDGRDDVILGNPNADGGRGEVIVIFATNDLVSPAGGFTLPQLLSLNDSTGKPRAIRLVGRAAGDQFGFNVAVVGDFNGDGEDDLLVSAPGASPAFDSNDDGTLDTNGIDVVNLLDPESEFGDGAADAIPGAANNLLTDGGEVYLILGSSGTTNNLGTLAATRPDRTVSISELGSSSLRGVIFVGKKDRDALGGGREAKRNKRSFGVGPAGDVDGDGRADILIGAILADPDGRVDAGEAYLIYGFNP